MASRVAFNLRADPGWLMPWQRRRRRAHAHWRGPERQGSARSTADPQIWGGTAEGASLERDVPIARKATR